MSITRSSASSVPPSDSRYASSLPSCDRGRVDQHPLDALPIGRQQHAVVLAGCAAQEEAPLAAPVRGADGARVGELGQPGAERLALRLAVLPGPLERGVQLVLRGRPGHGARGGRVLQPTVGVGHAVAVQLLDQIEPFGPRVSRRRERRGGHLEAFGGGAGISCRHACDRNRRRC
jgi:hypothetical protein